MAVVWTKLWGPSDDGTVIRGVDIRNIQNDINATGLADADKIQGFPVDVPVPGDDGKALIYDDGNAKFSYGSLSGLPAGLLLPYAGSSAPSGWLLCYGQAVSRTTYADLFAIIGITYGPGDTTTTFNLPDLRGRMPLGLDNMGGVSANRVTNANADTLGGSLGNETENLAHTHNVPARTDTGWGANGTIYSGSLAAGYSVSSDEAAASALNDRPTGSSGSATQDVMNPVLAINYIIKI